MINIKIFSNCRRTPHPDQVTTLNYNGHKPLDLGTPPRLCYPLVIFLIRNDIDGNVHPDETVSWYIKSGIHCFRFWLSSFFTAVNTFLGRPYQCRSHKGFGVYSAYKHSRTILEAS